MIGKTGLLNEYETNAQLSFLIDNIEMSVYLKDDVIIK